jgi:hypothetical protein
MGFDPIILEVSSVWADGIAISESNAIVADRSFKMTLPWDAGSSLERPRADLSEPRLPGYIYKRPIVTRLGGGIRMNL